MDAVLMFKTPVLSALYNLSDDQIGPHRTQKAVDTPSSRWFTIAILCDL